MGVSKNHAEFPLLESGGPIFGAKRAQARRVNFRSEPVS